MLAIELSFAYIERMTRDELANRLHVERVIRRLSLREVAKRTGMGIGSLCEIERGKRNLSYDKAYILLRFYGLDFQVIKASDAPRSPAGLSPSIEG